MALIVANRVKENTSTTGVGGITFTGSPNGFQPFSGVMTNGDITYYVIEENDKWEVGIGTFGSNNMTRTTILASSNGGSAISLGGSGIVSLTYPAEKATYLNENDEFVLGASGLLFTNGTVFKEAKLVELTDVLLSGTPTSSTIIDVNVTSKGLSIGDRVGSANSSSVIIGYGAASGTTSGYANVVVGAEAATNNQTGFKNVHIGNLSGPSDTAAATLVYNAVSVGYQAGSKMRHNTTALGYLAGYDAYEVGFVAVGAEAGYGIGSYSVGIGNQAMYSYSDDYAVGVGYQAGHGGGGENAVWIGHAAGKSSTAAERSIGIGKSAGQSSTGDDAIYIGNSAGKSNTSDDYLFIGNGAPSSNRTLIKGDMQSKRLAIGAADVSLSDTLYIGIADASDKGLVVKGAASQSADLTQWVTSADAPVASISNSGVITANALFASGQGLELASATPITTANTLYNVGGDLYFNGGAVSSTVSTADLTYVSGIAVYASGQAASLNYASGLTATNATNITATTAVANYASGQSTSLNYVSGVANYTSGVVTGGNPTFGNMYVDEYIYHNGDTNTYIRLRGDQFDFVAGGRTMLTLDEAGSDIVTVNDGANDVDFQVKGDSDTNLIRTDAANDLVGIGTSSPAYKLDVFGHDAWVQASGIAVGNSGVVLANNAPAVTTNTLYNDGGTLKFNGSAIGGGDVTTAQLEYVSGVAVYGSGQAQSLGYASGVAIYASGQATSLNYASGLTATNASNISTNTSNISTNTTNITSTTAVANYASGQATSLNYASGLTATNASNISTNTTNITATTSVANYASGQATSLNVASGVANYASGNTSNIHFGSNAEGDLLYHDGSKFIRLPKGTDSHVLTMDGNVPAWEAATGGGGDVTTAQLEYVSGVAVYGSGQAIENEADILALLAASGQAVYASGNTSNIHFGSNAEGDILYHNGSNFIRLAKGTDNYVLTMNGNVPNWEASVDTTYTAGDGLDLSGTEFSTDLKANGGLVIESTEIAVDLSASNITGTLSVGDGGTGSTSASDARTALGVAIGSDVQAWDAELDTLAGLTEARGSLIVGNSTPAWSALAIGSANTVLTSDGTDASWSSSFPDIANYASGQVNVTDGVATASKALVLDSNKSFTGVKDGVFNQYDSWVRSSGIQVGASGIVVQDADLSHAITIKSPDVVSTSYTLPLPSGIGTNGQVLTTDGVQTYWSTVSGGGGGDIEGVTAGNGLSGGGTSGTVTLNVEAAQTVITSLFATDIKIGEDDETKIDFEDADKINFYANNEKQLVLEDGALYPGADNIIDLGKSDNEFKDAFFDGTVTADAFAGPLTGNVTGNADTVTNGVYTSNNLSVMASTTSAQLAGVISDETGTGSLVFASSPTLVTPALGTPSALVGTNISGTAASLTAGKVTVSDSTANTNFPVAFHDESNALLDDTGAFIYNPSTGLLTATAFAGDITGDVTGNADTATALATGRTIAMTGDVAWTSASFTGAGNVTGTSTIQADAIETAMIEDDAVTYAKIQNVTNARMLGNNAGSDGVVTEMTKANVLSFLNVADGADVTTFTLAGDGGSNQTITAGNTLTVAGGNGITTTGAATDTVSIAVDAAQTTITSILATDLKIGEDDQTKIDFEDDDKINFYAGNEKQLILEDGALYPGSDNIIDLGKSDNEFKNAYFDGTVTSDAFAGPLTGNVTGNADTATALANGRTIGMTGDVVWTSASFDGTGNVTGTSTIQADAVETAMIEDDAVTADKLANTAVTAGSYTAADITVDAQGRITAAANGTIALGSEVSGTLPVANGGTGATSAADARTNLGLGTAAVLDTGISNTNVPKFTTGVADDDFLRVNGTAIEGRSASEVLSDISAVGGRGNGAAGNVAFWSDANTITDDPNQLYWDASDNQLGVGTGAPTSTLAVSGNLSFKPVTITDSAGQGDLNWTGANKQYATSGVAVYYLCETGGTSRTINLPDPAIGLAGRTYSFKKIDSGAGFVTVQPYDDTGGVPAGGYIDGDNAVVANSGNVLFAQYDTISATCAEGTTDGRFEWHIVQEKVTPHAARLRATSTQDMAYVTATKLEFDTCDYSTVGSGDGEFADNVNDKFLIKRKGRYHVFAQYWFANFDGPAVINIYKNNSAYQTGRPSDQKTSDATFCAQIMAIMDLDVGDYLEVYASQWNSEGESGTVTTMLSQSWGGGSTGQPNVVFEIAEIR